MPVPRQIVTRLPARALGAVRRAGVGIGLAPLVLLEDAVDQLAEAVRENASLEAALERRVEELEQALVPLLDARRGPETD